MNRFTMMTIAALFALGISAESTSASGCGEQPMTLRDCMEYAISHSTKMRIEAADRDDERLQRRQAILQAFTPAVSAQTYAYNQYGRNLDPETNTYNTVTTFHNGYGANAGITVFNGFKAINNIRLASLSARLGRSKEQQTIDGICLATMEAFCNVIYYTELERVLEEQVLTAQAARDKVCRQEELGLKGHADVLQMESEYAGKQYQLITSTNQKNDALLTLKDVMFWPSDDTLMIDSSEMALGVVLTSATDLAETAKATLPSAEMAAVNKDMAATELKMARGAYSPTLSFYSGWSTTYYTYPGMEGYTAQPFGHQFKNNAGEYLQLSLSIPIYDQFRRRTTLKQKQHSLVRAEATFDQTMRDIENEAARALGDLNGAIAAFQSADKLASCQHEAFELSKKQFENGLISTIEYQTASQNYLNAMAERINAQLVWRIKFAVVQYYKGESYIPNY